MLIQNKQNKTKIKQNKTKQNKNENNYTLLIIPVLLR